MKTLIAAALAASALVATTAASANPVYRVDQLHPIHHAAFLRRPIVYRHAFAVGPIRARPVVYREGFFRPGVYRTAYDVHGHRGHFHAPFHAYGWRHHGLVNHPVVWRGTHVGEHRPV